jgi:hypothetical protein
MSWLRRRLLRSAAGGAAAVALSVPAAAQLAATLDAGGGSARIDQASGGSIALFAPALTWHRPNVHVEASGVYSGAGALGWNAAGFAATRIRSPRLGAFRMEAAGRYRWSAHALGRGTGAGEAELGLSVSPARWATVSLAGAVGSAASLGRTRPVSAVRAGARAIVRGVHLEIGVDRTSFTDRQLRGGVVFDSLDPRPDTLFRRSVVEYTDASVGARWQAGPLELSAAVARRLGRSALQSTAWSVSAMRWLTPQLALVAGTGHYAADPASSLPPGRYATVALRIGVGGATPAAPRHETPARSAHGGTRARRGADGVVALQVDVPKARSVELKGDFTDWATVALERARSGRWELRRAMSPGIHHLVVRIDGGEWQVPPGAQAIVNEFGVPVGALLVE